MRNKVQYSLESYDERREDESAARKSLSYNLNIVLLRTTYVPQNAVQDSEDSIHALWNFALCFRDRKERKHRN